MSELITSTTPNLTVYALVFDAEDGLPLDADGSTNTAFSAGSMNDYAIVMSEQGGANTTGRYLADFPAAAATGAYYVEFRSQAGANPAVSDTLIDGPFFWWWDKDDAELRLPSEVRHGVVLDTGDNQNVVRASIERVGGYAISYPGELLAPSGSAPEITFAATAATHTVSAGDPPPGGATFPTTSFLITDSVSPTHASASSTDSITPTRDFAIRTEIGSATPFLTDGDFLLIGLGTPPANPDQSQAPLGMNGGSSTPPSLGDVRHGFGIAHISGKNHLVWAGYTPFFSSVVLTSIGVPNSLIGSMTTEPNAITEPPLSADYDLSWVAATQTWVLYIDGVWASTFKPEMPPSESNDAYQVMVQSTASGNLGFRYGLKPFSISGPGATGSLDAWPQLTQASIAGGLTTAFSVDDASATATSFKINASALGASATVAGQIMRFETGDLAGTHAKIATYTPGTQVATFASGDLPAAPANGDAGQIYGLVS